MRVLVDVTDATRPILSVTKGADTGAMTIFKPYGVGKSSETMQQSTKKSRISLDATEGFNVVHETIAYVLDAKASQRSSEQYVHPVISNNKLQRALSQASQEHEKSAPSRPRSRRRTLTSPTRDPRNDLQHPSSRDGKSGRNTR